MMVYILGCHGRSDDVAKRAASKKARAGRNSVKRKPHYDLEAIKASFVKAKDLNATTTTRLDFHRLGFTAVDVVATIQSIERRHFNKSMTTNHDYRVWQDVYYVPSEVGMLYIKFQSDTDAYEYLLIGFKEKDDA